MTADAPASLGPVGAGKWAEFAPRLKASDPVTLGALEVYCASYERWQAAIAWLEEHGDVLEIVSDKGVVLKVQPAPKLDVAARAEKSMIEAGKRLGPRLR